MSNGGKGSAPRPFGVSKETYGNNFDTIFRKSKTPEPTVEPVEPTWVSLVDGLLPDPQLSVMFRPWGDTRVRPGTTARLTVGIAPETKDHLVFIVDPRHPEAGRIYYAYNVHSWHYINHSDKPERFPNVYKGD